MSTNYYIECKMGPRWVLLHSETRQADALHYIKDRGSERYPLRIVKVVRTVVFEDKKK